ncbi:hypothetical protein PSTG_18067, partial [Puccinia striiformis f. sp. tritici PST-78]
SEDDSKPSKVKSDWVDLLKLRFSDGPSYTGPPQAIEPFLQWITALQIFFDSKAISHPADKMIVAGGLLKTTALLSFYSNEGKDLAEKTWDEFKERLFKVALPVRWRTTLKTLVRQLKMSTSESFVDFSTRGRTLQAMINFDAASNLPDEALAEYIVLGLSVELRGKANEWELLEANPFKYPHFEKRLAAFDEILKEQAPPVLLALLPHLNPVCVPRTTSPGVSTPSLTPRGAVTFARRPVEASQAAALTQWTRSGSTSPPPSLLRQNRPITKDPELTTRLLTQLDDQSNLQPAALSLARRQLQLWMKLRSQTLPLRNSSPSRPLLLKTPNSLSL